MSAEFFPDCRTWGISINSKLASCMAALKPLYRSQSQYAFLTTILPLSSRRSSTGVISNRSYLASRTPRATFSKSQQIAMLMLSDRAEERRVGKECVRKCKVEGSQVLSRKKMKEKNRME